MPDETMPDDPAVLLVDEAANALETVSADTEIAAGRLRRLGSDRRRGRRWSEIFAGPVARDVLALLGSASSRLVEASRAARRAIARGLASDGLRVGEIGTRLGVTHQRVSQLLNEDRPDQ